MDATSSYQAATKIDQTPLQSAQEIYAQAVSSGVELQSVAGLDTNFDSADNVTTGGGGGGTDLLPLQIRKVSDTKAGITAGAINTTAVDADDDITISATTRIWAKVTLATNKTINTVEVHVPGDTNTPTDTDSIAYALLAEVQFSGGEITSVTNFARGSLGYGYGGSTFHFFWLR